MKKLLKSDILVVEDFLTKDECQKIISLWEKKISSGEFEWMPISFYEAYTSRLPNDYDPDYGVFGLSKDYINEVKQRVVQEVEEFIGTKPYEISFHCQKYMPGAFVPLHSDNTNSDGSKSAFERSRYAAFIYLNDDYEGGELIFRHPDGTSNIISPKAGTLAIFNGGMENQHEVMTVLKNVRWTLGSFWDDRPLEAYNEDVKEFWEKDLKVVRKLQEDEQDAWKAVRERGMRLSRNGQREYPAHLAEEGNI